METVLEYGNCKLNFVILENFLAIINQYNDFMCLTYPTSLFSFGNLFSATERIGDPLVPYVNMKYTGSEEVGPALSTMRARSSAERKNRNPEIFDGETM